MAANFIDHFVRVLVTGPGPDQADPRIKDLFFMSSFRNVVILICVYLFVVYWLGPKLMEILKEPLDTYTYLSWHNIFLVTSNATLGLSLLALLVHSKQNILCEPVGIGDLPNDLIAYLMYVVLFLKIFELNDAFPLVCKKQEPPFILIFHHVTIVVVVWAGVKYGPGGSATFPTLLNCLVHVLIYLHFKYGRLFVSQQQSRKIFILIYFVQFIIVTFLSITTLHYKCGYPEWVAALSILYNIILMLVYVRSMFSLWCTAPAPKSRSRPPSSSSSSSDSESEEEIVLEKAKTTGANNKSRSEKIESSPNHPMDDYDYEWRKFANEENKRRD